MYYDDYAHLINVILACSVIIHYYWFGLFLLNLRHFIQFWGAIPLVFCTFNFLLVTVSSIKIELLCFGWFGQHERINEGTEPWFSGIDWQFYIVAYTNHGCYSHNVSIEPILKANTGKIFVYGHHLPVKTRPQSTDVAMIWANIHEHHRISLI